MFLTENENLVGVKTLIKISVREPSVCRWWAKK